MELRLKIGYKELLDLIKQLPASQMAKLKSELTNEMIEKKSKKEHSDFQKLLLSGPIMTEDQYAQYLENRKAFNQWRMN